MTHLTPTQALHGSAIIQALKQVRVEFVLSVPDICTSEGLLRPIANDPNLRLVRELGHWSKVQQHQTDIG